MISTGSTTTTSTMKTSTSTTTTTGSIQETIKGGMTKSNKFLKEKQCKSGQYSYFFSSENVESSTITPVGNTVASTKPTPREKVPCNDQIISFHGNGFFEFTDKLVTKRRDAIVEIEIHLSTSVPDGVLIWKRSVQYKDYISLGLWGGRVSLDYHYSKLRKTVTVVSTNGIADGKKHSIRLAKLKGGDSTLQIDENPKQWGKAGLGADDLDQLNTSEGPLYLGGLPPDANVEEATLGLYTKGFSGCITYINISNTVGTVTVTANSQDHSSYFYKTREHGGVLVENYGGDVSCGPSCSWG